MEQPSSTINASNQPESKWQPLRAVDRRVAGVLAEKAKTTPDIYPMSLNAVCTACNQKSNRSPLMNLEPDDAEESLDRLRELGAVTLVEGHGRVAKYRHHLYQWMGVDKVELAIMTELLLRGPQTLGELRGRAARMEPIADLAALRPILDGLKQKGLVVALTPEGRGHVVTHALYLPEELQKLQSQYGQCESIAAGTHGPERHSNPSQPASASSVPAAKPPVGEPGIERQIIATIRSDIDDLKSQLTQLRSDMDRLVSENQRIDGDLQQLKDALGA